MSPPNGLPPSENTYTAVPSNPIEADKQLVKEDRQNGHVEEESDGSSSEEPEIVVPPDGGWGWVVVAASFACNMVVDGIIFSFGIFIPHIVRSFNSAQAPVSLVGSLMSAFYLMAGPFASAIANRYGFRIVAIAGSILGAIAFAISYFATSVEYLYVSYGIIGGIGFGLIYVPAVITVGFYFERWRALATGIGVCGSGIGTFLFAPICSVLIDKMGWRYALLVQGGVVLTCIFFGALFRPLKPTKLKDLKEEKPELVMDSSKLPAATRLKMEHALRNMKTNTNLSQSTLTRILGANNNSEYPTVADVYHTISVPQQHRTKSQEKRLSVPFINDGEKPKEAAPLIESKAVTPIIISNRKPAERRNRTTSESSHPRSRKGTLTGGEVNRPLYRDDIFFGASLTRLPQFTSQSSIQYNLTVTRVPTKHDIDEEKKNSCTICPEAMRRTLATMLDVSLLKSPSFLILAISGAFTMMGFYVPFMFLTDRAERNGMNKDIAIWLLSTIGIANTVGRVLCGILSSFPKVNTLLVNNVALSIGGIATIVSGLSNDNGYQFTYSIVFGFAISCFASLRSILVVELLGLDRLTNAFGLLLLFQGAAAAFGAPAAGAFLDLTGSYDFSFYLSGSLLLTSAVICYPLNAINRWELNRNKNKKSVPV